jgi:hypothetical protein
MPAPEPRPEPLERARARLEFDALVRNRLAVLRDTPQPGDEDGELRQLVDAIAREFADAVDRENSTRSILRTGVQVEYVDAVVLTGSHGVLVVDSVLYDEAPVYAHARAGVVEDGTVIRGRDLDGYLRTGDQRYAERLGLA